MFRNAFSGIQTRERQILAKRLGSIVWVRVRVRRGFVFDSKSENRDRAVEAVQAVEAVSEALGLGLGLGSSNCLTRT